VLDNPGKGAVYATGLEPKPSAVKDEEPALQPA